MLSGRDLVSQCKAVYNLDSTSQLAEEIGMPTTTLQTWSDVKISSMGALLLKTLIINKEQEKKLQVLNNFKQLLFSEETK